MLVLNIVLCLFALTTTIYAAVIYYQTTQHGHQVVGVAVHALVNDFTLPKGYVAVSQFADVTPSPVINITTEVADLNLTIQCLNPTDLAGNYSLLQLQLWNHTDHSVIALPLNLLTSSTLRIPLPYIDTYVFDYHIEYTPSRENENGNEILLDVRVTD